MFPRWNRSFPYPVDYNDHFETPEIAYRDILPLLDFVHGETKSRNSHRIYDPYFCNGRTKELLNKLGFMNVIHEQRDFYHDIDNNTIPLHDTMVTNPPFSDQHKKRCLEFALDQLRTHSRPFFVLMPNYVAAREYYRNLLEKDNHDSDIVYLVPSRPYEYDHPEGTGKDLPPFNSLWYCGIGKDLVLKLQQSELWQSQSLLRSLNDLRQNKVIPTNKRPNPKQRQKRKSSTEGAITLPQTVAAENIETSLPTDSDKKRKRSKHRNEMGLRTKKRF